MQMGQHPRPVVGLQAPHRHAQGIGVVARDLLQVDAQGEHLRGAVRGQIGRANRDSLVPDVDFYFLGIEGEMRESMEGGEEAG